MTISIYLFSQLEQRQKNRDQNIKPVQPNYYLFLFSQKFLFAISPYQCNQLHFSFFTISATFILKIRCFSKFCFLVQTQRNEIETHQDEYQEIASHLEDLRTMCDPKERKTLIARYRFVLCFKLYLEKLVYLSVCVFGLWLRNYE